MEKFIEINPTTEEIYKEFTSTSKEEINKIVENARQEKLWKQKSIEERINILKKILSILEQKKELFAKTMALEIGKPLKAGRHELTIIKKCIEDYLQMIPEFIKDEILFETETEKNIMVFEPLGTVIVITPWNAPLFLPLASIIPALVTGNNVIFKPSEYSSDTGLIINEIFNELKNLTNQEFPENSFQIVIGGKETGNYLVKSDIDMVVLIGSLKAGQEVMKSCVESCKERLKRFILELGGKDPAIILEEADLNKAAREIVKTSTMYTGQVCFGVERVYCHESVYEEFLTKLIEETNKIKAGDPSKEETDIGPFSVKFQLEKVNNHIKEALEKGAKLIGGKTFKIFGNGYFMEPGILTNVNHEMKIMKEETFGPITPIMKFKLIEEAIKLANDSEYGLTASIWTKDLKKGQEIAKKIEAGTVEINRHGMSKVGCPWGGYKKSGIGRIYSKEGIRSFCNTKHIWVVK